MIYGVSNYLNDTARVISLWIFDLELFVPIPAQFVFQPNSVDIYPSESTFILDRAAVAGDVFRIRRPRNDDFQDGAFLRGEIDYGNPMLNYLYSVYIKHFENENYWKPPTGKVPIEYCDWLMDEARTFDERHLAIGEVLSKLLWKSQLSDLLERKGLFAPIILDQTYFNGEATKLEILKKYGASVVRRRDLWFPNTIMLNKWLKKEVTHSTQLIDVELSKVLEDFWQSEVNQGRIGWPR